jgi:hypothetical protein
MEKPKLKKFTLIADIVILIISFLIIVSTKPSSFISYFPSHLLFFILLAIVWVIVSIINGKLYLNKIKNFNSLFNKVLICNLVAVSIIALFMYILRRYEYSRTIVLGTIMISTLIELILGAIYLAFKNAVVLDFEKFGINDYLQEHEMVDNVNGTRNQTDDKVDVSQGIINEIENESGHEMMQTIIKMTGRNLINPTAVLSTSTIFNITSLVYEKYNYIINLRRLNDIRTLDDFMDAVNRKLELNGYFLCCVETKEQRKNRLLKKFPPVLNHIYYSFDFIIKRVLPKFRLTRGLYLFLTRGANTVISRAEVLGRLSRAGFKIKQEIFIGNKLCIEARKKVDPLPKKETTYGALIALPRIGKAGKMIKVYKLRTMHPYSEYIQEYVYSLNHLQEGGKFKHDFRITTWGQVFRKIWLDELPMFINLLKGEMKLVGVRPLSRHYFELYKKEVRDRRIRYKPGLIPPFYYDLPADLEEIQASELKYLDSFDKQPFFTDFRYFWKSWWNILFGYARSY